MPEIDWDALVGKIVQVTIDRTCVNKSVPATAVGYVLEHNQRHVYLTSKLPEKEGVADGFLKYRILSVEELVPKGKETPKDLTVYVAMAQEEFGRERYPVGVYTDAKIAVQATNFEMPCWSPDRRFVVDEFASYWSSGKSAYRVNLSEQEGGVVVLDVRCSAQFALKELLWQGDRRGDKQYWTWTGFAPNVEEAIALAKAAWKERNV